jgi:hypothetical protein
MVLDLDKLAWRFHTSGEWVADPLFWPVFYNLVWLKQSVEFRIAATYRTIQSLREPGFCSNIAELKRHAEMFCSNTEAHPHAFPKAMERKSQLQWEITVFGAVGLAIIDLHETCGLTSIDTKELHGLVYDWQRQTSRPLTVFGNQWSRAFKRPEIVRLLAGLPFVLTR